jgi:hypothetical protein
VESFVDDFSAGLSGYRKYVSACSYCVSPDRPELYYMLPSDYLSFLSKKCQKNMYVLF